MNMFKGVPIEDRADQMQRIFLGELFNAWPDYVGPAQLMNSIGYKSPYLSGVPKMSLNSIIKSGLVNYSKFLGYMITAAGKKFYKENYLPPVQPLPVGASGPLKDVLTDFMRNISLCAPKLAQSLVEHTTVLSVSKQAVRIAYHPAAEEDLLSNGKSDLIQKEFSKVYGEDPEIEWEPQESAVEEPTQEEQQAAQPISVGVVGALVTIVNKLFPGVLDVTDYWVIKDKNWSITFNRNDSSE